jgi:integrase
MEDVMTNNYPNNPTVDELCEAYLADRRNPHAERKCKDAKGLACHLKVPRKLWGSMSIDEFRQGSRGRVKAKCDEWRAEGLSPFTVRKRVSILKTVFKFAHEEELIDPGQVPTIKLPKNGSPRERFVDPVKELPALLKAADRPSTPAHIRLCLHLSLRTGQRQGAIADLTWDLVDFEARVIRFRDTEAAQERSQKKRTDIPMDDALCALLLQAKEAAETAWVLEWRGKRAKQTYHGMMALYKRAGITGLHRHDLRRTAATLVHRGLEGDLRAAASFIGDTEKMAEKHYVKTTHETLLRPVEAIASVLARAQDTTPGTPTLD